MLSPCRKCHKLVEMPVEEAYTPEWCCSSLDRLCMECYQKTLEEERAPKSVGATHFLEFDKRTREYRPVPIPGYVNMEIGEFANLLEGAGAYGLALATVNFILPDMLLLSGDASTLCVLTGIIFTVIGIFIEVKNL